MLNSHIKLGLIHTLFMSAPISRRWFGLIGLIQVAALLLAFTLQYGGGIEPCPLCILQRLVTAGILIISFIAMWCAHRHLFLAYLFHGATLGLLLMAIGIAGRHVWIEHLPPLETPPACGASLQYLLQIMPWQDAFKMILTGSGECQQVAFSFLGLSFATWTFFYCLALLFLYFLAPTILTRTCRSAA